MIIEAGTLPPPNGKLVISSKIARRKNPHIDARSRHYRYLTTVIPTHIINNSLINKRKYIFSKPHFQHPPPPKSSLAHETFLRKPPSATYSLTPDRRKTLVFSRKSQETCPQRRSSGARGEAHSGSDIDILVVFDKEAKVSLMRHAKISLELSEILGFDVDLITEGTLLSFAERTANNDKILIYERA